jgi:hypothetical protein
MKESSPVPDDVCRSEVECHEQARANLPEIAERIIDHCENSPCYTHIDSEPIPSEGLCGRHHRHVSGNCFSPDTSPVKNWIR